MDLHRITKVRFEFQVQQNTDDSLPEGGEMKTDTAVAESPAEQQPDSQSPFSGT
jgi:hypothetical protein